MPQILKEVMFSSCSLPVSIFLKGGLFSIIWVIYWYCSTAIFFRDVEATIWAAGIYALPIPVVIIMLSDYFFIKKAPQSPRPWGLFLLLTLVTLALSPLWVVVVLLFSYIINHA